ncbi:hypothetical protein JKF63_06254 [Porcisia hertigi]|uniref:Uncharacterized protein n=1 Tax=Porcisia hertigi TaxID=2761500 RepID=A0A836ICI1_9TRYP|nr:hypothetical protein JKF63_06254 [Porcisia hertigi]
MQSDFGDVETELRDIEETFANGRMNAFGSAPMQDAFVHELKRIAEIETQVFYRTCALLKTSSTNGHKLVTNMYASAQPPPQSQRSGPAGMPSNSSFGDGSFRASGSGMESSSFRSSMSQSTHLPSTSTGQGASSGMSPSNGNVHSTFPNRRRSHQASASFCASSTSGVAEAGGSLGAAPHISQNDWGNENGFADKAFEDVAAHFEELESQFFSLGDHLRDISKHVTRLNDMSKQLNTTTSYGVPTTPGATATVAAKNISENTNNNGVPPKLSTLGRQDHAMIIDGGDGSH